MVASGTAGSTGVAERLLGTGELPPPLELVWEDGIYGTDSFFQCNSGVFNNEWWMFETDLGGFELTGFQISTEDEDVGWPGWMGDAWCFMAHRFGGEFIWEVDRLDETGERVENSTIYFSTYANDPDSRDAESTWLQLDHRPRFSAAHGMFIETVRDIDDNYSYVEMYLGGSEKCWLSVGNHPTWRFLDEDVPEVSHAPVGPDAALLATLLTALQAVSLIRFTGAHPCLDSTFELSGETGSYGKKLVPLFDDNADLSITVSSTFEGGYSTLIIATDIDSVTITWSDGSRLYVDGVSQGSSGSVVIPDPNGKQFWFERPLGPGFYSSSYSICVA